MKRQMLFCIILLLALILCSCGGGEYVGFNESLLYGKWQEGSVYERYYDSDIDYVLPTGDTVKVNGTTWDESDDVSEDEAQAFRWTLTGATLTHIQVGAFTDVSKAYTITPLTSSSLC